MDFGWPLLPPPIRSHAPFTSPTSILCTLRWVTEGDTIHFSLPPPGLQNYRTEVDPSHPSMLTRWFPGLVSPPPSQHATYFLPILATCYTVTSKVRLPAQSIKQTSLPAGGTSYSAPSCPCPQLPSIPRHSFPPIHISRDPRSTLP